MPNPRQPADFDAYWDALRPEEALSGEVDYGRYA